MGTNYYLRTNECQSCGRYEELHIGKSSCGWTFSFQAYPEIRSWKDWIRKIQEGNSRFTNRIFDEYGQGISLDYFEKLVESKKNESHNHTVEYPSSSFLDDEGNSFSDCDFS